MASLFGFGEVPIVRNVRLSVAHARRLLADPRIDPSRLVLAGHSAGGGICLEACAELERNGIDVAGCLLLDAVPWARTAAAVRGNHLLSR